MRWTGTALLGFSDRGRLARASRAFGLTPYTCFPSLSGQKKQQLLDGGVVLCRDLLHQPKILLELGVRQNKIWEALDEAGRFAFSFALQR